MKNLDLNFFPSVSKKDWHQLAEKQLKGAKPEEALKWSNSANIDLLGYYDQSDLTELGYLKDFFDDLPSHRWKLYQRINNPRESEANREGLEALTGGCDGLIFNLTETPDWNALLENIDTTICDIGFNSDFKVDLDKYTGPCSNPINGNTLYAEKSNNPINQISKLISDITDQSFIHRFAQKDFFLEIATIRALRYLLAQKQLDHVFIHTSAPLHESDEHQWFLNTTVGLSSILGGSHSIDLPTAIGNSRISRNVGNLIRDESGIYEYTDQCGGAFYVEILTDHIIKKTSKNLENEA
ncbi:MAG: methylmalonyl-CoA mutase family protein [Bacteroidota bacterium]